MKKLFMAVLCAAALCPTLVRAQQPEEGVARHAVKLNMLSPFAGSPAVSYEYGISRRSALQADLGGTLFWDFDETLTPYALFLHAQYRFYLNDQRRSGVMPFLGVGINYTHAWEHFDCFVGNRGWEIATERYTLRSDAVRPTAMFGLKVNIPFGLVLESTVGFRFGGNLDYKSPARLASGINYLSTLCTMRIGWAF